MSTDTLTEAALDPQLELAQAKKSPQRLPWRVPVLLIFVLGCTALGWLTLHQWSSLRHGQRFLSASLLAQSTADYSQDPPGTQVAQVGLGIISDMLEDSQLSTEELAQRLATVSAVLLSPVPTTTPLPPPTTLPATAATERPASTIVVTWPPTSPPTGGSLPTATKALPAPSTTLTATATPSQEVTLTPLPITPTRTPTVTASPTPRASKTPTPGQSPNPTLTPTPTQTPGSTNTPKPTQAPEVTKTSKPTNTPKPTNTHRPTRDPTKTQKN